MAEFSAKVIEGNFFELSEKNLNKSRLPIGVKNSMVKIFAGDRSEVWMKQWKLLYLKKGKWSLI